jgi:hypothetical protein
MYYCSNILETVFEESFEGLCPIIKDLLDVFNSKILTVQLKALRFVTMESRIIKYNYTKFNKETIRIPFSKSKGSKKTVSLSVKGSLDYRGLQRSILANFVHTIDAGINFAVLQYFQNKGIFVSCTHDC